MFLQCSNTNEAATVLKLFEEAVDRYGLPSRIRIDKGGENTDIAMYLLTHPLRGPGRSTVIAGKSVHNQRIERMWRDVFQGVLTFYRELFYHMEDLGILVTDFCLHYIYIPRINKHLATWKEAWAKHPMRSENNFSPEQLWISGLQKIACSDSIIAKEVFEDISEVGS